MAITTETLTSDKNILIGPDLAYSIGVQVTNTNLVADDDGKKIILAGTPIGGKTSVLANRQTVLIATNNADTETAAAVAATCVVAAASATTDILTVTAAPASIATAGNDLSINLTTAEDDVLAVSATGAVITIALANSTATKNTAALIQVAIRALSTVDEVAVDAFTCVAGGSWDSAAIATGETGAVDFTGGTEAVPGPSSGQYSQGVALHDVDVTDGQANGEMVVSGFVDSEKITAINPAASTALTEITFQKGVNK